MDAPKQVKPARKPRTAKSPEQRQQERRKRFTDNAERRVNKALHALNNVARCGNRAGYYYTEAEANKISETLLDAATAVRDAFSPSKGGKALFTL